MVVQPRKEGKDLKSKKERKAPMGAHRAEEHGAARTQSILRES